MPRFSDTVVATATREKCWETLQDATVWGALLGAAGVSEIQNDDGLLRSCAWTANISGSQLAGTMKVAKSVPEEIMVMRIRAAEWRGGIEMSLESVSATETRLRAELELTAEGFTALLALPIVSSVVGRHFPERMQNLVKIVEA